ncbi:Flp pilus assembly complex ATPase component TadA (plasmid) [Helicobacter cinaedi]|uniref:ATPase, T2SS/T4P/T4SS family n=1 Tax=Helicobacter TaxID=209 RepID=UPI0018A5BB2E|nr:ATPase, T2SS/T4P/T4SS family [Helicobacter cinaedi]QOQ91990.1 Flp pilus assembly complex ATPase component TadA [Helicobacter cinaedi]BDB65791.1 conjugal transfer protein TrbB [Helicobacter cinaedi]
MEANHITPILMQKLKVLDKYLRLEANELIINKTGEICVDYGLKWEYIEDSTLTYSFLESFLLQLATRRGQRFNEKHPSLSCELPPPYNRYRLQAQHNSILFHSNVCICIRIPSAKAFELEQFILSDKVKEQWDYEKIKALIPQRKNVLVSGGTGTGKTSFLNALMNEIPQDERIVTIEDSQELMIENKNKTQLAVPKEENEIYSYTQAINNAMRLRPDRLLLGEIDIRNTLAFLRINNTGHEGNLSTLHANNSEDAINALITNAMFGGMQDRVALKAYIRTAIDFIIQIKRQGNTRIVNEILDIKNHIPKEV